MAILTILFIGIIAWFIYHFILAYTSGQINRKKLLRRFDYGKSMGLFALITGITGQMVGLYNMFLSIETALASGKEIIPELVFGGIKVTMIVTIYGMLIYLFSLLLWFVATIGVEKKEDKTGS